MHLVRAHNDGGAAIAHGVEQIFDDARVRPFQEKDSL